jgi:hypothetical protein
MKIYNARWVDHQEISSAVRWGFDVVATLNCEAACFIDNSRTQLVQKIPSRLESNGEMEGEENGN